MWGGYPIGGGRGGLTNYSRGRWPHLDDGCNCWRPLWTDLLFGRNRELSSAVFVFVCGLHAEAKLALSILSISS